MSAEIALAYRVAVFGSLAWAGKLKPIETYMPKAARSGASRGLEQQTVAQQRSMLAMLSERLGVPLRHSPRAN